MRTQTLTFNRSLTKGIKVRVTIFISVLCAACDLPENLFPNLVVSPKSRSTISTIHVLNDVYYPYSR